MFEPLVVESHRWPYTVLFEEAAFAPLNGELPFCDALRGRAAAEAPAPQTVGIADARRV